LKDLQKCHLVADMQQFMSIVMSHCHYSFTLGKGTQVDYDISALERHFISSLVHGRPQFDLNSAIEVLRSRDIHTPANFAEIRQNVHPQVREYFCLHLSSHKLLTSIDSWCM